MQPRQEAHVRCRDEGRTMRPILPLYPCERHPCLQASLPVVLLDTMARSLYRSHAACTAFFFFSPHRARRQCLRRTGEFTVVAPSIVFVQNGKTVQVKSGAAFVSMHSRGKGSKGQPTARVLAICISLSELHQPRTTVLRVRVKLLANSPSCRSSCLVFRALA